MWNFVKILSNSSDLYVFADIVTTQIYLHCKNYKMKTVEAEEKRYARRRKMDGGLKSQLENESEKKEARE